MTSPVKTSSGVSLKTYAYENFQGLDTSRDVTSLDTGKEQHLSKLVNATCDWRGQIVREPSAKHRKGSFPVKHVRYFNTSEAMFVEQTGSGLTFRSERDHVLEDVYPTAAVVSSTIFNQNVQICARLLPMYNYDGTIFKRNQSKAINSMMPAYCTSVQRRLAVAGINGKETEIHLSRVDQDEVFPDDEEETSTNALRAGYIDIANIIGTADKITGLGTFEQNRLVVFTSDKAIVYKIDASISNWLLDDNAYINIGCASHNTIQNAGTDLLFCSRSGIHSIKRSEDNGLLVYSYSLSDKIDILYRELFNSVENQEDISATFDQDSAQYHVFFPQSGGFLCRRLTLSLNPEAGQAQPKFSEGEFLNARSGDFLNGKLLYGTTGGIYEVLQLETVDDQAYTPDISITTPLLWHGSLEDTKETHSLVIQAAGKGIVNLDAQDLAGRTIGAIVFEVDDTSDDNYFQDVPLSKQYERSWKHRYKAAQYRMTVNSGDGLLRIIGIAVTVRT